MFCGSATVCRRNSLILKGSEVVLGDGVRQKERNENSLPEFHEIIFHVEFEYMAAVLSNIKRQVIRFIGSMG